MTDLTNASREELLAAVERLQGNWTDLTARIERAERTLATAAEACSMNKPIEEARLKAKRSGVSLVRDYMRAY